MAITSTNQPTLLKWITPQEIRASVERVEHVNAGNYGTHVIQESVFANQYNSIGSIRVEDKNIFVTFRGSLGLEFLSLANIQMVNCNEFGFTARVHKGLHGNFNTFKESLKSQIQTLIQQQGIQLSQVRLTAEGFSRGGGFATLTAALVHQLGIQQVDVLTYASIGVFNEEGANNYHAVIGKENHLSFKVTEDIIPTKWGTGAGFSQLGTAIEFSVKDNLEFKNRMNQPGLSCALPMAVPFISMIFSKEQWEGHMLASYRLSAEAFENYKAIHTIT